MKTKAAQFIQPHGRRAKKKRKTGMSTGQRRHRKTVCRCLTAHSRRTREKEPLLGSKKEEKTPFHSVFELYIFTHKHLRGTGRK